MFTYSSCYTSLSGSWKHFCKSSSSMTGLVDINIWPCNLSVHRFSAGTMPFFNIFLKCVVRIFIGAFWIRSPASVPAITTSWAAYFLRLTFTIPSSHLIPRTLSTHTMMTRISCTLLLDYGLFVVLYRLLQHLLADTTLSLRSCQTSILIWLYALFVHRGLAPVLFLMDMGSLLSHAPTIFLRSWHGQSLL